MKSKLITFFNSKKSCFEKIGNNSYLRAISTTMMSTLGLVFIGSVSVLLIIFTGKISFLNRIESLKELLFKINTMTLGTIAVFIVILISFNLSKEIVPEENSIFISIISLISFLIVTPINTINSETYISTEWLGTQGIFSALFVGIVTVKLFKKIKNKGWTIKMPPGVPSLVTSVFESLIPTILISLFFIILSYLFSLSTFQNIHYFIYYLIQEPLKGVGGSIITLVLLSLIQQLLWFFGIPGSNIIMPLVTPIWLTMDVENLDAIREGITPPNITGLAFFNIVTWSGLGVGLVLLMLRAKSKQYREIGKLAFIPALFGITEPVIFGVPLVLNFNLAVPFITNNAIALILSYGLIKIGLVSKFIGVQAIFGLPLGFHAAVQGSLSIILLQIFIQIVLSPILWYPWFKKADLSKFSEERNENNTSARNI